MIWQQTKVILPNQLAGAQYEDEEKLACKNTCKDFNNAIESNKHKHNVQTHCTRTQTLTFKYRFKDFTYFISNKYERNDDRKTSLYLMFVVSF